MSVSPLALLALFVVFVGTFAGWFWLWVITGFALACLIGLLVLMYRQDLFVGPKVLFRSNEELEEDYPQFTKPSDPTDASDQPAGDH